MKNLLLIAAIFILPNLCFSQTKLETTNWISAKFNKWKTINNKAYYQNGFITGGTTEKPTSITFVGCTMTLKTTSHYYLSTGFYDLNSYSLNIGDINNVEWINSSNTDYLVITTGISQVKNRSITKNKYSLNDKEPSEIDEQFFDRCIIPFNTNGEDNFKLRMIKAFNHLRTFCSPTIKDKEAF